ncbi:MBL fold metallo-hydrolase [Granulicella arctica]|uniref:L-ascorbate metabolism protein UlaG (Beta-lactamase superfamily) n=1 Tax=Granulicella arctica TaxID=940613 RepID=A0A7Y9PEX9_9BACT|nr:MBL fold metallo-hydrolase [Granulicella arctica]NYF77931.1 L-ascorbate metabolism protein UlaG (beta-lactamase superfamily) [Granulicella arctica]
MSTIAAPPAAPPPRGLWKHRPFAVQKIEQLVKLVHESHAEPLQGEPHPVELVQPGQTGVTFIGHSSFLLQVAGKNILVDPVFSTRLVVLRRQRRPGVTVASLPPIDLILLTHAHMDHLDKASLRAVIRATRRLTGTTPEVVVPHGVDDLVASMGFRKVHAMQWWDYLEIQGLGLTMTPCRHWGARMFRDTHRGYGGYCITGGGQSIYHSGDTAYFSGFAEIGTRLKPDVALLPIGAYFPDTYRTVHTSPEEAVRGFIDCGARWMIPMHFGTFRLGREPMDEPVQRLKAEARRLGIQSRIEVLAEGATLSLSTKGDIL